jgi:hypothetical protein
MDETGQISKSMESGQTVQKIIRSIGTLLEKNSKVNAAAENTASAVDKVIATYIPTIHDYFPNKKVGREIIFLSFILVILSFLYLVGAARVVVDFTGVLYPIYASVSALENKTLHGDTQWIAYWVIHAAIRLSERILYPILSLIPMYLLIKLVFFAWLYHPDFCGARQLYRMCQPHAMKLILIIHPDFKADNAGGAKAELTKRKGKGAVRSSLGTESEGNDAILIVHIKTVALALEERTIFVASTVVPKVGRTRSGIENTCLKTKSIIGKCCAFNEVQRFMPLPFVDGTLTLEVFEQPTFDAPISRGKTEVSLLDLALDGQKREMTLKCGDNTLTLDINLITGHFGGHLGDVSSDISPASSNAIDTIPD